MSTFGNKGWKFGRSSDNNYPIESFNKQIKDCFTKYASLSVINVLNVICREIIVLLLVKQIARQLCSKSTKWRRLKRPVDAAYADYDTVHWQHKQTNSSFSLLYRYGLTVMYLFILYVDLIFASKLFKFTIGKQSIPAKSFVKLNSSGRKKKKSSWLFNTYYLFLNISCLFLKVLCLENRFSRSKRDKVCCSSFFFWFNDFIKSNGYLRIIVKFQMTYLAFKTYFWQQIDKWYHAEQHFANVRNWCERVFDN